MFETFHSTYKNIISSIGIIGYLEEDIKKRGLNTEKNLELNCLYAYPSKNIIDLNPFTYQMMFPDNNHKIPCPKFFTLSLTNEQGTHSYLYCLKFSENYSLVLENEETKDIDVPLVIFIKSKKQDLEAFRKLLNIINYIIVNDDLEKEGNLNLTNKIINNYKKIQLINLFYFIFSLPHAPPHSLVKLKIEKEIFNNNIDSIDFYFSSNCEIPCNKNDTDINFLFLLLDLSIIVKVLFSILTEKQIVFMASQAYILHIIIPSFLKLIFPFKFLQSCITVLPKEKLNFLEAPGAFIFGVLSNVISLSDLMNEYPGKIVIDCDTNEIFGENFFEPYIPPQYIKENNQNINNENSYENKSGNINTTNKFTQGNNLITVGGNCLYKYENDSNIKKTRLIFDGKNNIIIDIQKSQLLIDKTNAFIDSNEWKWIRKNIQLVRNPEIFDLDNISHKKNNINNVYLNDEDDDNCILPNRPFSYNIQNIFMKFLLNKLEYPQSEFMSIFKKTNLYMGYNNKNKYQNNSGRIIVENILDLKNQNQQMNINNSFLLEYNLQNFKTQTILEKIEAKLENKTKINELDEKILNQIKLILNNYSTVKNEEDSNNFDEIIKDSLGERKSEFKKPFGRLTKSLIRTHERNKTSLLRETNTSNFNFILSGSDKSVKDNFKFYKEDGFLNFVSIFEKFLNQENIHIKEELYEEKINEQILEAILNNEDIFNQNIYYSESNNLNLSLEKSDSLSKKDNKKNQPMSTIIEKTKEEEEEKDNGNNNDIYYGRSTVIQKYGGDEIYVSGQIKSNDNALSNSINYAFNNLETDELGKFLYSENIINFFPNFAEHSEDHKINMVENNENINNNKCQFYLFIALVLENILEDKKKSEEFIDKIKNKKKISKMDIHILIFKLYRIAYKFSGNKHRDFPYFSYYNYLCNIDLEDLKSLKDEFQDTENIEQELFEIYEKVINDYKVIMKKKLEKKVKKELREKEKKLKAENDNKINIKSSTKMQEIFSFFENKLFEKKKKDNIPNFISSSEFNLFKSYTINTHLEFNFDEMNMNPNEIMINFARELLSIIPNKKDINNKKIQDIITESNKRLMANKKILELICQLKYIYPEKLVRCKERVCFWVNCFNFLIIFTIIYKKWNINDKEGWKFFLQNVKYLIGNKYFTFNDMLYLLYKKTLFFESSYKVNDEIKKLRIDKADDAKNIDKKIPFIYNTFMIYIPTKDFNRPIILEENKLEIQLNEIVKEYLNEFIIIDKDNTITLPELLIKYQPRFLNKEYKKFQHYLNENLYSLLKEKKFKNNKIYYFDWKLDFDRLLC